VPQNLRAADTRLVPFGAATMPLVARSCVTAPVAEVAPSTRSPVLRHRPLSLERGADDTRTEDEGR